MREATPMATRFACTAMFLVVAACSTSCTSVYHVMMHEMAQCEREVLATRVAEARDDHIAGRAAFEETFAHIIAMSESQAEEIAAHRRLQESISRAELKTWNVQRRLASVRDVAATYLASRVADNGDSRGHRQLSQRCRRVIDQMDQAHKEMHRALAGLQQQAVMLRLNIEPHAAISLQPIAALSRADQAHFIARIDEAIRSADEFVAMLETDGEMIATDRARGRVAAR